MARSDIGEFEEIRDYQSEKLTFPATGYLPKIGHLREQQNGLCIRNRRIEAHILMSKKSFTQR